MLKNIVVRIFAYSISFGLISVGCITFSDIDFANRPFDFKAFFISVSVIMVSLVYLVSDILYQIKHVFFKDKD